jgi:3-methyl-2-oxobutanoate hydroxymethyltransferase
MTKITVKTLLELKKQKQKITCLTSYDAAFSRLIDEAGIELILVGDSLGMVVQGGESTLPVNMADMVYHTKCVAAGVQQAMVIADMPFGSYLSEDLAMNSAVSLMKAGANMVKLEGNFHRMIGRIVEQGIPVCGHIGLQPQSVNVLGGYSQQGKGDQANKIMSEARDIQAAGAQLLVMECVPNQLAADISAELSIPTIGIGAGVDCDGQVLVLYDMLGITPEPVPKFVKNFMQEAGDVASAIALYKNQVKSQVFPNV